MPYPDGSFDVIVGTFVLCSARDVPATLRESLRVLSGGCRLDHDVRAAIEEAGLRIIGERSRAGGLLVEIVTAA